MVDWNTPTLTDEYSDFLEFVNDKIENLAKHDFESDTNIPTGTRRLNSTTNKWEIYTGASWAVTTFQQTIDNHISDSALHGSTPVGTVAAWLTGTPPSNWIILDGVPKSRTTYAPLFALWGTTFGAGDGSTTFGIPDTRSRMIIGRGTSGAPSAALGSTFGTLAHSHVLDTHTHTIDAHTHDMASHTHTGGAHTHSTPAHTHTSPAHYHSPAAPGATLRVASSGSHTNRLLVKENGTAGAGGTRVLAASASGTDANYDSGSAGSNHTHPNEFVVGLVGNVTSGISGDSEMTSGSGGSSNTGSGGAVATGAPSTNTTGGTALTTNPSAITVTSSADGPSIIMHWIVKAI